MKKLSTMMTTRQTLGTWKQTQIVELKQWKIQKQTKKRKVTLNAKNATTAPTLKLTKIHQKENWFGEITNKF